MVAKVRERLAVRKQAAQEVVGERFNLGKLNELEVRKRYQIEITNRFTAWGNVENDGDINRAWEDIKESIKTSAKESLGVQDQKKYKPWFDEECLHEMIINNEYNLSFITCHSVGFNVLEGSYDKYG